MIKNFVKSSSSVVLVLILLAMVPNGCKSNNSSKKRSPEETRRDYYVAIAKEFIAKADSAFSAEKNAKNYYWKAEALEMKGKLNEAIAYTDTALTLCGEDLVRRTRIHSFRAYVYGLKENSKAVRAEHRKVIDIGLKDYVEESMEAIARSYYHDGMYREALAALPDSLSSEGEMYYNLIMEALEQEKQ